MSPLVASVLWGLGVLGAFAGLGRWLSLALRVRGGATTRGHELAWGFAGSLALGGWLCLFGLATLPALLVLVALGLAGWLAGARPRPGSGGAGGAPRRGWTVLLVAAAAVTSAVTLWVAVLDTHYHAPDDQAAYLFHAQKILQTGSLLEPFSFRRIASYGGQSFLHALLLVGAPLEHLHLVDKGVCRVAAMLCMLAVALARPRRSLAAGGVCVYVLAVMPDVALNTSSLFSGVLAFVGLWATLEWCRSDAHSPVARGVVTGLVVAAVVPLRQNYGLAAALIVAFEHLRRWREARERGQLVELAVAAGVGALGLCGWLLLQTRSSGTPFFPLVPGFANPAWGAGVSAESLAAYGAALRKLAGHWLTSFGAVACLLALAPGPTRGSRLWPLGAGALLALLVNAWLLAHANVGDFPRYTLGFVLPVALFVWTDAVAALGRVRRAADLRSPRLWVAVASLVVAVAMLPPLGSVSGRWQRLRAGLAEDPRPLTATPRAARHARLQAALPEGAPAVAMLDDPYLLDLERNDVASLDLPGGVSPPPGLHTLERPEDVARYFVEQGRPWLLAVRPTRSRRLHRHEVWAEHAAGGPGRWQRDPADVRVWTVIGGSVTRFHAQLGSLIAACRRAHDDGLLVALDLERCDFEGPTAPGAGGPAHR